MSKLSKEQIAQLRHERLYDDEELLKLCDMAEASIAAKQEPIGFLTWPNLEFQINGEAERIGALTVNAQPVPVYAKPVVAQAGEPVAWAYKASNTNKICGVTLDWSEVEDIAEKWVIPLVPLTAPPSAPAAVPEGMVLVPRESIRMALNYCIGGECNARVNYPNLAGDFSAIATELNAMLSAAPAKEPK
jgi:hypothetical protein